MSTTLKIVALEDENQLVKFVAFEDEINLLKYYLINTALLNLFQLVFADGASAIAPCVQFAGMQTSKMVAVCCLQ